MIHANHSPAFSGAARFLLAMLALVGLAWTASAKEPAGEFTKLFPDDGIPAGWRVGQWNDVSKPVEGTNWNVTDGVLHGSKHRGTWLMSDREYENFVLEFEFKLGETGNSGLALRAPMAGDPAFDGMELQMADYRYNTSAKPSELTGGIYRAIAPREQVYKPTEWNSYQVTLNGSKLKVVLNGEVIHDLDLDQYTDTVPRHDGTPAPAIKDRPRKGRIGFQELGRGGVQVQIRNARIKVLE